MTGWHLIYAMWLALIVVAWVVGGPMVALYTLSNAAFITWVVRRVS